MTTSADLTDILVPALRSSCGHLALGENVQTDVVHDELSSLYEPCGNHSSEVFPLSDSGSLSRRWPNTTVFRKRASSSIESNSVGSSCSQVVDLTEASSLQASLRRLGGRKVPGVFQAREKLREPTVTHTLLHGILRPGCVALAPTLGYQPALRLQCLREPAKEAVVILDPVEGGGREDQIHRFRYSTETRDSTDTPFNGLQFASAARHSARRRPTLWASPPRCASSPLR
jgi:hypothetical protein